MKRSDRHGTSLIEILIVIAMIGLLLQLILPAIQSSREAARRITCVNNLKQIGLAATLHEQSQGYIPSNGWCWWWMADPNRGYGKKQPGSWMYNVLAYMGEERLRELGHGKSGTELALAMVELSRTPLQGFNCPTRRDPFIARAHLGASTSDDNVPVKYCPKVDYVGCQGSTGQRSIGDGMFPTTMQEAEDPNTVWYQGKKYRGVCHGRSEIRIAQVIDGTSKTYFGGEKFMNSETYLTAGDEGDDDCSYAGFSNDVARSAADIPQQDDNQPAYRHRNQFGSAHPGVVNMIFCDGSVHTLGLDISITTHKRLAAYCDGEDPAEDYN